MLVSITPSKMNGAYTCNPPTQPHFALDFVPSNSEQNCVVKRNSGLLADAFTSSTINKIMGWDILTAKDAFFSQHSVNGMLFIDDLVCVVDACKRRKDTVFAQILHTYIHSRGLESHESLGNYLVPLLVECGGIQTACQVFQRLRYQNEHSWTSLIQGYVECGNYEHALFLLEKMQENGIHPNKYTFLALLQPCVKMKWLEEGQILHAEIVKEELDEDPFIGSTLACFYARAGSIREAEDVFDVLPVRDVVVWNTLISGNVDHGVAENALGYLYQMELEPVAPDIITYACSLKACRMIGAVNMGRKIHLDITKKCLEIDPFAGSTLVGMYADCECLEEAYTVFDKLPSRDVVVWSTLILGYVNQGLCEEALNCLKQMRSEGVSPDAGTFVCGLKACCCIENTFRGREIHMEIVKHGFDSDMRVSSSLLDMYTKSGSSIEAIDLFEKQPVRDVVMWNTLMAMYIELEMAHTALNCLKEMRLEGMSPNTVTLITSLKACASVCAIERGREIHALVVEGDLDRDPFIGNSLVDMYANSGQLVEARDVFDELLIQDVVSWSALMAGYADHELDKEALNCLENMLSKGISPNAVTYVCALKACGNLVDIEKGLVIHAEIAKKGLERGQLVGNTLVYMYSKCSASLEAEEIFKGLLEKDAISWNTAILGFSEQGDMDSAFAFFGCMQEEGVLPDSTTLASIIKACRNGASFEMGKRIHGTVTAELVSRESILSTALIDMYGRCGGMVDAQRVFDQMHNHSLMSWTSLITGYAHQGESTVVLQLFERMREEGIQPNGVTFLSVLSACKHGGFADKAQHYLKVMTREYDLFPTEKHQNCVVDLFCRAGRVDEMIPMLQYMPLRPGLVAWSGVLSACQQLGDVELATKAFDGAISCAEDDAVPFVFLSNIIAFANM